MSKYPVLFILLLLSDTASYAHTNNLGNWDVEGASGRIEVRGRLVENACWLDLASAYQEIDLGVISIPKSGRANGIGNPVILTINLRDCIQNTKSNQNYSGDINILDDYQPSVSVSFLATTVASNARLVSVSGVKGIGLAIKDMNNQYAKIGTTGTPLILDPGQNSLKFTITPEYVAGPITAGSFNASILFYMKYN